MEIATLALFVPACLALNMAPGPNNLLSLSNATRYGFARSCAAGSGRLVAFAGMLFLTSVGLSALLHASELLFTTIKFVGAAYLFYLAVQLWRAAPDHGKQAPLAQNSLWGLARQEFFVAAGNPKAILIFTAFLPQFVNPAQPSGAQFAVLGALFLVLEVIAMMAYSTMGIYMRRWFSQPRGQRLFNRGCSAMLAGAGVGLLAARR
ncbi:MAG: LysE family translocator [Pseudomonadota bacterium]